MAPQRPGKTYLSAAQKAEKQVIEQVKEEEEVVKRKARRRLRRRPPPRFSNLFIKKNENEKDESNEQYKENVSHLTPGTKVKAISNLSHTSQGSRKPLGVNNSLATSTNSGPSFSDTFDRVFGKASCASKPHHIPKSLCSLSSSESLPDSSGLLFKSLLSTESSWAVDKSSSLSSQLGNCVGQTQQSNDDKIKLEKEHDASPTKESQKPSIGPIYSPQLFTSDIVVDSEYTANASPSPLKTRSLRQRTHRKQAHLSKQQTTKVRTAVSSSSEVQTTRNTSRTDSLVGLQGRESFTSQPPPPKAPPEIVQRFLGSLGVRRSLAQSSPSNVSHVAHQNTEYDSPPFSGKSSGKSSLHTSTPAERSKWGDCGSPSLEIKVSPVPKELEVVTDNSSIFQSPLPSMEGNRIQSGRELEGSPSLPSKYETCFDSGRFKEDTHPTSQQCATGESGNAKRDNESPSFKNGSEGISQRWLRGAMIPKISFECSPQQEPPLHESSVQILFASEPSIIISKRARPGKAIKRLESSHSSSTTHSPKVFNAERSGKVLSPWLVKRFSPKVTRSRSRLLGQESDESHHVNLSFDSSHAADESLTSWTEENNNKNRKNFYKRNIANRKSKVLVVQKTESIPDTDESTMDTLPDLEVSRIIKRRGPRRTTIVSEGSSTRNPQGLPPLARRSMRLSRKRNSVIVSGSKRRSTRLLSQGHSPFTRPEHDTSRSSNTAEPSILSIPSDLDLRPKRRKNDLFIFHQRTLYLSTTHTSLDSWQEGSHTEPQPPPLPAANNHHTHTEKACQNLKSTFLGPVDLQTSTRVESMSPESHQSGKLESWSECNFLQPFVKLTRLEDSVNIKRESLLPTLPVKPGKGWRRSIAIRARAASLTSSAASNDMLPPGSPGCHRKMSGLRISSFPLELNHRHRHHGAINFMDSPRRSVLQMSAWGEKTEASILPTPTPDSRQQVLELCSQEEPLPLTQCFTDSRLASCRKIGEGVYGEVFMTRPDPNSLEGATVLKVMPIEGDFLVNGEPQKKFEEILSEMVISLELSGLRAPERQYSMTENFVHVKGSWCVEGSYPQDLLHLWDLYKEEKGSENDRPDIFPDTQLYVVLEFGHGGRDLESFVFNNARDLMAIFLQIAYSLAVAEEALEFEHRDLHWGNVLVAPTTESKINFKLSGETYTLNTHGLKATVIDFTLSRIKLPHCIVFNNLAEDPSLFTSEGDYQFEVYRQMQHTNNNQWESFKPYTNVLWLHYLLVKMSSECYIKNNKTKLHRTHQAHLLRLRDAMLTHHSSTHFLLSQEPSQ